jgi:hypothetical protein
MIGRSDARIVEILNPQQRWTIRGIAPRISELMMA